MGARLFGKHLGSKPDNDNQPKAKANEIPLEHDERRTAPVIEKEAGKGWYCLITVPQGEYRCQDALSEAGVPSYVPTETYWERRRKGRDLYLTELQRPMFRGYVFAHLPHPEWRTDAAGVEYPVLPDAWGPTIKPRHQPSSPAGVLSCLGNNGYPVPMPIRYIAADGKPGGIAPMADEEREGWFDERKRQSLIAFREARTAEALRLASLPAVAKGDRIQITEGPFAGATGTADNDNDGRGRFRILTSVFGGMALMEVSLEAVENLDRPMHKAPAALRRA
jgi:transcription antitermination factor NusG